MFIPSRYICWMLMPPISQFMFLPQICRFCWNKLRTEGNGLCPACRQVCHCSPCRISQPWGGYYSLWINILSCHNSLEFSTFCFAGLQREPSGFQAADHGGDGSHQGGEEAERSGSSHFFGIYFKTDRLIWSSFRQRNWKSLRIENTWQM